MLIPPTSLWWSTLKEPVHVRPALSTSLDVDVAIIGGGFTGLWTARELLRRDPALRVVVLEQSVCGFGASGRNGGWASALYPVSDDAVISRYGLETFHQQRLTLQNAVAGLGRAIQAEGIDAHFVQGGTLTFARSDVQASRLRRSVEDAHALGISAQDRRWMTADEAAERARVSELRGAMFSPHCARLHPGRLVRGLADATERAGAVIFEDTQVTRITPGNAQQRPCVSTVSGTVRAEVVVRATEGFTATLPGHRRDLAPIYSLMIATEPLPSTFWETVGFQGYETFADDRHLVIYGQRTNDDRLAFGGRGAPYHFGSTVEPRFDLNDKVFSLLASTLRDLFPDLDAATSFQWGGPLAMPRDQSPSVTLDTATGLAAAGGYTGDGVVLSYVAAQALADLIVQPETPTEFTTLPFVQRRSAKWEFEPARWLGVNTGLALANWSDRVERRRHVESRATALLDRLFDTPPR